jgi:hypothetical protein
LSPPDFDNKFLSCNKATKNKEDAWYNLPFDLEDEDDDSMAPVLTLPLRLAAITLIAFTIVKPLKKSIPLALKLRLFICYMKGSLGPKSKISQA